MTASSSPRPDDPATAVAASPAFAPNDEQAPNERPVSAVAATMIGTDSGARIPAYVSTAWEGGSAASRVTAALVVIHGRLRNADVYYASAEHAIATAGRTLEDTVLVVPQFLAEADIDAYSLDADILRWTWTGWMGGDPAIGAHPDSSFAVLDAIVAQLAMPERFPALTHLVIAGHSGGGQVVHRYAVVGRDTAATARLRKRYVIANPSSYVYFDENRPLADGGFAAFDRSACADFDHWKYGPRAAPAYAAGVPFTQLEQTYAARDVRYLWGEKDNSPTHPALDTSCAANAQGPDRLSRGRAYFDYLQRRHGDALAHRAAIVPGVGHDGDGILTSAAGIAALFGD